MSLREFSSSRFHGVREPQGTQPAKSKLNANLFALNLSGLAPNDLLEFRNKGGVWSGVRDSGIKSWVESVGSD